MLESHTFYDQAFPLTSKDSTCSLTGHCDVDSIAALSDSDSHQYTPVWDVLRELMLHVDPVTDPQPDEQSDTFSLCVYRLTLHPVESLCPSQLSERESVIKC